MPWITIETRRSPDGLAFRRTVYDVLLPSSTLNDVSLMTSCAGSCACADSETNRTVAIGTIHRSRSVAPRDRSLLRKRSYGMKWGGV